MDRFLLCENPQLDSNRPVYILQTITHRMLIQVITYEHQSELYYKLDDVFDLFSFVNSDGITERYMLKVVDFYDITEDEIDDNIQTIRLHIKKAWKWFKSYIIWQDQQADFEGNTDNFRMN